MSKPGVAQWTSDFREFHPVVKLLSGVVLDDPNTSNHHVLLCAEPCSGTVLFLEHDGESRIVFPTLAAFLLAVKQALDASKPVSAFHPVIAILLDDQHRLSQFVSSLLDREFDEDFESALLVLIPSMDLADLPLLRQLAMHDNFYVVQAVANAIANRPRPELKAIAESCQRHPHSQAAKAGHRALDAIAALDAES